MDVDQLVISLMKAFPLFNEEAVESWRPVFERAFARVDGETLAEAFDETLADFKPEYRKPFPIVMDFEKHLPAKKSVFDKKIGPKLDFAARKARAIDLIANWIMWQRPDIVADRGPIVAARCEDEVACIARNVGWKPQSEDIRLSGEQIQLLEDSVVSIERVMTFGRMPATNIEWQKQMDDCRAMVHAGRSPSAEGIAAARQKSESAPMLGDVAPSYPDQAADVATSDPVVVASKEAPKINTTRESESDW